MLFLHYSEKLFIILDFMEFLLLFSIVLFKTFVNMRKLLSSIFLQIILSVCFCITDFTTPQGTVFGKDKLIDGPWIDTTNSNASISVGVGLTAFLPCKVFNVGDKTVSWIRRDNLHILSSGNQIYTSDPRVSLLRKEEGLYNSWTLKIMTTEKKDDGFYECQVNTEPKMTVTLYLKILDNTGEKSETKFSKSETALPQLDSRTHQKQYGMEAKILGPSTLKVRQGGHVILTCIVNGNPGNPLNLSWFLNDVPINRSSAVRGGISIETNKSIFRTISVLRLIRSQPRDEGKYTCGGDWIIPASIILKITEFEETLIPGSVQGESEVPDVPKLNGASFVSISGFALQFNKCVILFFCTHFYI